MGQRWEGTKEGDGQEALGYLSGNFDCVQGELGNCTGNFGLGWRFWTFSLSSPFSPSFPCLFSPSFLSSFSSPQSEDCQGPILLNLQSLPADLDSSWQSSCATPPL